MSYQCGGSQCKPTKRFITLAALNQHRRDSASHPYYCDHCVNELEDEPTFNDHMASMHGPNVALPPGFCNICQVQFPTADELDLHRNTMHLSCLVCNRDFVTYNALDMHLRSLAHIEPEVACPKCQALFKTSSGVSQHLESGSCAPITRRDITQAVKLNLTLTNQPATPGEQHENSQIYVPRAGNQNPLECCGKRFVTELGYVQHLSSAAHDSEPDTFQCPKCHRGFSVISALTQHVESESCGIATFGEVQQLHMGLVDLFRAILL